MEQFNIFELILNASLFVKLVMLVLFVMSVASWAIILKKFKQIKTTIKADHLFYQEFLKSDGLKSLHARITDFSDATLAKIFNYGFYEFESSTEEIPSEIYKQNPEVILNSVGRSIENGQIVSRKKIEKDLGYLASISSVAPFIGLLGTVWGIVDSFRGLAQGGGSLELVAPGIAEALVATALGLFAAIPAVWFYNLINQKFKAIKMIQERFSLDFINLIQKEVYKK